MKLIDAYNLLVEDGIADNHRYFSEVFKHYEFTEDRTLKDYLDFIEHEPYLWMKGFPARLTTKLALSKPKTAVIKLLKKTPVIQALGADYVNHIYSVIWNTFKKEIDSIVAERNADTQDVDVERVTGGTLERHKEAERQSVGSVETFETLPILPLRLPQKTEEDRVEFLKTLLFKLASDWPQTGAADAFRLLVSRV